MTLFLGIVIVVGFVLLLIAHTYWMSLKDKRTDPTESQIESLHDLIERCAPLLREQEAKAARCRRLLKQYIEGMDWGFLNEDDEDDRE